MIQVKINLDRGNICSKCNEEILLGKWCSYECLKARAQKEGVSEESLIIEMMEDEAKVREYAENINKNDSTNMSSM